MTQSLWRRSVETGVQVLDADPLVALNVAVGGRGVLGEIMVFAGHAISPTAPHERRGKRPWRFDPVVDRYDAF